MNYVLIYEVAKLWHEGKCREAIEKLDNNEECWPAQLLLLELEKLRDHDEMLMEDANDMVFCEIFYRLYQIKPAVIEHSVIVQTISKVLEKYGYGKETFEVIFNKLRRYTSRYCYYKKDILADESIEKCYYLFNKSAEELFEIIRKSENFNNVVEQIILEEEKEDVKNES